MPRQPIRPVTTSATQWGYRHIHCTLAPSSVRLVEAEKVASTLQTEIVSTWKWHVLSVCFFLYVKIFRLMLMFICIGDNIRDMHTHARLHTYFHIWMNWCHNLYPLLDQFMRFQSGLQADHAAACKQNVLLRCIPPWPSFWLWSWTWTLYDRSYCAIITLAITLMLTLIALKRMLPALSGLLFFSCPHCCKLPYLVNPWNRKLWSYICCVIGEGGEHGIC